MDRFRGERIVLKAAAQSGYRPTFAQLRRCTWGAHITACGQPAKFHQAGVIEGHEIVAVSASSNAVLSAECRRQEAALSGETIYYVDYARLELCMGTPHAAPLLREQAALSLRSGDVVQVNETTCTFLGSRHETDGFWLLLLPQSEGSEAMHDIGAEAVEVNEWGCCWRMNWQDGVDVRLVSDCLPNFEDVSRLRAGTTVTVGAQARPARLRSTQVVDGTKQFVLIDAAPWLNLHQAESRSFADTHDWLYRIRFEEAGLRLTAMEPSRASCHSLRRYSEGNPDGF
jgi:hypothetical protein